MGVNYMYNCENLEAIACIVSEIEDFKPFPL